MSQTFKTGTISNLPVKHISEFTVFLCARSHRGSDVLHEMGDFWSDQSSRIDEVLELFSQASRVLNRGFDSKRRHPDLIFLLQKAGDTKVLCQHDTNNIAEPLSKCLPAARKE